MHGVLGDKDKRGLDVIGDDGQLASAQTIADDGGTVVL